MNTYKLIDYFDVWGNEIDGFWVNDCCTFAEGITITNEATNEDILNYLKTIDYLKQETDISQFEVVNDFESIEIFLKENNYPVCCLVKEG